MPVEFINKTKQPVRAGLIKRAAERFLAVYQINNKELSIALVGDRTIKRLNKIYRGLNRTTDILAFAGEAEFLGEIIIDYSQIKRQAKRYGNTVEQELVFILAHGLLHLLGYDDATEPGKRKMERLANEFLKRIM